MTEKEKSHAGMLYQPGDPELVSDRDITVRKLYEYNKINPLDREEKKAAIKNILGKGLCYAQSFFFEKSFVLFIMLPRLLPGFLTQKLGG